LLSAIGAILCFELDENKVNPWQGNHGNWGTVPPPLEITESRIQESMKSQKAQTVCIVSQL